MRAWTLPLRSFLSSTRRSSLWILAAGLAFAGAGCRRSPEDSIRFSTGYVKLDDLVHRHPGWQDVRQLDAMIAHASNLPAPSAAGVRNLPEAPLPPALQRQPLLPAAISVEKRRIEAVKFPARQRIERLQGSALVRMERAVNTREKELRTTTDAELRQLEADMREESRRDRVTIESKWYVPVRDLWLREFALETQVATYRPYPTSPAYKMSQERLAEVRGQRQQAEQQLAMELDAVEKRLTQKLADARSEVEEKFSRHIAEYRKDLESKAGAEMRERLAAAERVLSGLEPLERPKVPPAPESRNVSLPSPSQIAAAVQTTPGASFDAGDEIQDLRAQRERLAEYLQKDVKRRLNRLATQHRWRLAFGPKPGLDDITNTAAQLLAEEWTP